MTVYVANRSGLLVMLPGAARGILDRAWDMLPYVAALPFRPFVLIRRAAYRWRRRHHGLAG